MKERCPRCELAPLWPNEDGDPACFVCGYTDVVVPAWVTEEEGVRSPRMRRPSTQGMKL